MTSAGTSWGPVQTFIPANTALNKYSIPDLALWIDATDLDGDGSTDSVTNGTAVSSWTDKSVGGHTVTQSTADKQPTRQVNQFGNKASVRLDGNGDVLNVSTIRGETGGYSVYAAVRRPSQVGDTTLGHLVSESTWNLIPRKFRRRILCHDSQKERIYRLSIEYKDWKIGRLHNQRFWWRLGRTLNFYPRIKFYRGTKSGGLPRPSLGSNR